MNQINIIPIKQVKYSDNDLIVSCLSYEKGLISIIAYGARKIKKKQTPVIGLFRHLKVELKKTNKNDARLYALKKVELVKSFDDIGKSYEHFQSLCYISQFISKNIAEDTNSPSLFHYFLLLLTAYAEKAKIIMWECIFFINYLINDGYFHPQEESGKNKKLIEKIRQVEDNFLELNEVSNNIWISLHKWLEARCQFHKLVMPKKI